MRPYVILRLMSLVQCPECGGAVSTKADKCPHCGLPQRYFRVGAASLPLRFDYNVIVKCPRCRNQFSCAAPACPSCHLYLQLNDEHECCSCGASVEPPSCSECGAEWFVAS